MWGGSFDGHWWSYRGHRRLRVPPEVVKEVADSAKEHEGGLYCVIWCVTDMCDAKCSTKGVGGGWMVDVERCLSASLGSGDIVGFEPGLSGPWGHVGNLAETLMNGYSRCYVDGPILCTLYILSLASWMFLGHGVWSDRGRSDKLVSRGCTNDCNMPLH